MKRFETFVFKSYNFDQSTKLLTLVYGLDEAVTLTETYRFDFDFAPDLDQKLLNAAVEALFYMAGVSYYKAYLPPKIVLNPEASLDQEGADFFGSTYQNGLGEFFYVNHLDPKTPVNFQPNSPEIPRLQSSDHEGLLIGIGGGKDSLVTAELLRSQPRVATWSVGHRPQLTPLVERIGLPHFWV